MKLPDEEQFCDYLAMLREVSGHTMREFAASIGMPPNDYIALESGVKKPRLLGQWITPLADYFGLPKAARVEYKPTDGRKNCMPSCARYLFFKLAGAVE